MAGKPAARPAETGTDEAEPASRKRRRLSAENRVDVILREATSYFAEHGLEAGTVNLARRMGITQPLLYRYFPTKDALIDAVYERLYPGKWNPEWESLLDNDSIPVNERIRTFYRQYFTYVLTYEHVRLFLFSGLSNNSRFNARYYAMLTDRIFSRIVRALRRHYGTVDPDAPIGRQEMEFVESLHASVYHVAFRRFVHGSDVTDDFDALINFKIDLCLDGIERGYRWLTHASPPPAAG